MQSMKFPVVAFLTATGMLIASFAMWLVYRVMITVAALAGCITPSPPDPKE